MTMPELVQNLLDGKPCESKEIWNATVTQFREALQQFSKSDTPRDALFVREVLVYAEAHARLEIQGNEIFPNHEGELTIFTEWHDAVILLIGVETVAATIDELFWEKLTLRLHEKGVEEQDTEELTII